LRTQGREELEPGLPLQLAQTLKGAVGGGVIDDDPPIRRTLLSGERTGDALDVRRLVVHRRDDQQPL
jgi:hypothetical protein